MWYRTQKQRQYGFFPHKIVLLYKIKCLSDSIILNSLPNTITLQLFCLTYKILFPCSYSYVSVMFPCPNYFFFKSFLLLQVFNSCWQSQSICMWKPFSLLHRLANGLFSSPSVLTGLCFWSWFVEPCTWVAAISGLGLGRSFPPPFSSYASGRSCNSQELKISVAVFWRLLLTFISLG